MSEPTNHEWPERGKWLRDDRPEYAYDTSTLNEPVERMLSEYGFICEPTLDEATGIHFPQLWRDPVTGKLLSAQAAHALIFERAPRE